MNLKREKRGVPTSLASHQRPLGARAMRFRFADCVFEPRARRLTRYGAAVHITPKAALLLEHLLTRRPGLISQQQLRDLLWPGIVVGYNSIGQIVTELRKAIGDTDHRLIRTAYGTGYAFEGEVVEESDAALTPRFRPASFCLHWGVVEIPLREGVNVLGRGTDCDCRIRSSRVSRRHARIVVEGRAAVLDDLGSRNGTHLRGQAVDGPTSLCDGDVILLGHEPIVFSAIDSVDTTEPEER
jgi:DNA-binding winged helix-turn-helix (wHTH) protein